MTQNYFKAFEWTKKAAEKGFANAQYNLGWMYFNGLGIRQDYLKAVEWYQKAADQGFDKAQFNLARMYANGQGVKRDSIKFTEWLKKSADNGNTEAQIMLALRLGLAYQDWINAKYYSGLACDGGEQRGCDIYRLVRKQLGEVK